MSDSLHPGLEEISVVETRLSRIDGEAGELIVGGYPIAELAANATYEESAYLLVHGRLPTSAELTDFRRDLAAKREITDEVRAVLRRAADEGLPAMDALRMGIAAANLGGSQPDTRTAIHRVIGIFPTIVATYWRYRCDAEPVRPRDDLCHASNYLYMLSGKEPDAATVRALETYLNTVIEHGLNASTFSARVVVSTESDVVSAATAAVGTLKGPLHGGAPGPVLEMLRDVYESGDPRGYVQETLAAGERLMGFGHRVYRVRDPRASVLEAAAERLYDESGETDFFESVQEFEETATTLLAKHKPDRRLDTNVEFYTAVVLDGVGIPKALFTPTFAVSRVAGWMAHAHEQLDDNRLIRPNARYIGDIDRSWTPVDQR